MKYFLVLALSSLASVSASANTYTAPCNFEDYQFIRAALDSKNVDAKPSVLKNLLSVMNLEFGPTCEQEIWIMPRMNPSTQQNFTYLLAYQNRKFEISISYDKINKFFAYVSVN